MNQAILDIGVPFEVVFEKRLYGEDSDFINKELGRFRSSVFKAGAWGVR